MSQKGAKLFSTQGAFLLAICTPTFSTGQCLMRLAGGIAGSDTDTDNNYNDFVVLDEAEPRTSHSFKTPYYFDIEVNDTIYQYHDFELKITVRDYYGDTVIDYNDDILLSAANGEIIPQTVSGFTNGVYTAPHSLDIIGSDTIYAEHNIYSEVKGLLNVEVTEGDYDTGVLSVNKEEIKGLSETINVILNDFDLNVDPNIAETVTVQITSTTDTTGITLTLQAIDIDADTYDAASYGQELGITLDASDNINKKIQVKPSGDIITIKYEDKAPRIEITKTVSYNGLHLKLNEVMFDPVGPDSGKEWVELYNPGEEEVDVTGWVITNERASEPVVLPELIVPPYCFVLVNIKGEGESDTDFSDSKAVIYTGETTTVVFFNTKDQVGLYTSEDQNYLTIVDFMAYSVDGSIDEARQARAVEAGIWTLGDSVNASTLAEGSTLIRLPDGNDNNSYTDWHIDPTPTPGFTNEYVILPTAPSNLQASAGNAFVVLEWEASEAGEFELLGYNVHRSQISGENYVKINETTITGLTYIDYSVDNEDTYYYVVCAVDVEDNESENSNEISAYPTSAYGSPDVIRITEIMYAPKGSGITEPEYEWIEVYNPTYKEVNISGCILTDLEGYFTIPVETIIPAQSYFVFGYTDLAAGGNVDVVYGAYATGSLILANTNDEVILLMPDGETEIDRVDYYDWWRGPSAWYNTTDNKSIGRKYIDEPTNEFTNWARSLEGGGTPRAENILDLIPPVIEHDAIEKAAADKDLGLYAKITDDVDPTIGMGVTKVYYRRTGDTEYIETVMTRVGDVNFYGTIPYYDVTLDGVEYYIYTYDWSNNVKTHGTPDSPHIVEVIELEDKIVVNELMYDPAYDEPNREWFELHNYGDSPVNLNGWQVGNGRAFYTVDTDAIIPANGYVVFSRGDSTLNEGNVILYGAGIIFRNTKAVITDQVIVKNPEGVKVDELSYSSNWGAENISGPNETSLERLCPNTRTNDENNWAYSMEQGGSPGRRNSPHYVWDVTITPTLFNPANGETCSITYYQSESGTAAIKIYDENYNLVRTLISGIHRMPGTYTTDWDGKDEDDTYIFSVNTVEIEVTDDTEGRTCVHKINDVSLLGFNDRFDLSLLLTYDYDFATGYFYLHKPSEVSILIKTEPQEDTIAVLYKNVPLPMGNNYIKWDGRNDSGLYLRGHQPELGMLIQATGFTGNVVITQYPLNLEPLIVEPVDYFDPTKNDTQQVKFYINKPATVSVKIYDRNDNLIKTLIDDSYCTEGLHTTGWDGKLENENYAPDGMYTVTVTANDGYYYRKQSKEINVNKL